MDTHLSSFSLTTTTTVVLTSNTDVQEGTPAAVTPVEELAVQPITTEGLSAVAATINVVDTLVAVATTTNVVDTLPLVPSASTTTAPSAVKHATVVHVEGVPDNGYDVDAWAAVLTAVQRGRHDNARAIFEQFLSFFPLSNQHWRMYIEFERKRNPEYAVSLFARCLENCENWDLYRLRIVALQDSTATPTPAVTDVISAYSQGIARIGIDYNSTPLWINYIKYLKQHKASEPHSIRLVYQRYYVVYLRCSLDQLNHYHLPSCLKSPRVDIDKVWREYQAFEQLQNRSSAKILTDEWSKVHKRSRELSREMEARLVKINRSQLGVPMGTGDNSQVRYDLMSDNLTYT